MPRHHKTRDLDRMDWTRGERPTEPERVPLELQLENIDQQLQSPLFDGTIPPDIRMCIFEYAMAEYLDPECLYPRDTDYTRPNYLGKKKVSINVLLLCKKSYLEARHLPPIKKEHVFWCDRWPGKRRQEIHAYRRGFKLFQWLLVKKVHLFTQQFWLENAFTQYCKSGVFSGVEKIKITLRRGDWWFNESNQPLAITPQRPGMALSHLMKADWLREEKGEVVRWYKGRNAWGQAFSHLSSLRELEMEFETIFYKKGELEDIVRHAVKWKFPMGGGMVLACAGGLDAVKTSSWRGPPGAWMACPISPNRVDCKFCKKKFAAQRKNKGPMLTVMSGLIWKLAPAN